MGGGLNEAEKSFTQTLVQTGVHKKLTENTPRTCKLSVALDGCVKQSLQSVIVALDGCVNLS